MAENKQDRSCVILDIDGVVSSFSNQKFYAMLAYHSLRELSHLKGKKRLIKALPKLKLMGGPNALFKFARIYCGHEATFQKYKHDLFLKLNFNLIDHDPSLKSFMQRLSSFSDIIVRSDGLSEIARAVWLRVMENTPSAAIKTEMLKSHGSSPHEILFSGKPIQISDIVENGFKIKADAKDGWQAFADNHNIDLSKSVLIDDSRNNCQVAKQLGMTVVRISKLDSFLQNSLFKELMHKNLSDILGVRMSHTLKSLSINYGEAVDVKHLFQKLLETPVSEVLKSKSKNHTESR